MGAPGRSGSGRLPFLAGYMQSRIFCLAPSVVDPNGRHFEWSVRLRTVLVGSITGGMPNKTLDASISFDDIVARLQFTAIALELAGEDGDKDVAALSAPLGKLTARWADLDRERQDQARRTVRANAICKRRNLQIDDALTSTHNATLSAADQDRKAALFTHLFPKPLSELIRPALEGQVKIAEAFVERLVQSAAHAALRKAHEKPLRDAIAQGQAALKERTATQAAAADLSQRIDVLWTDANAALQATDGALKGLAAKRRLSKDWVDSFFPDAVVRPRKKPAAPPTPPTPPAGPAGPTGPAK